MKKGKRLGKRSIVMKIAGRLCVIVCICLLPVTALGAEETEPFEEMETAAQEETETENSILGDDAPGTFSMEDGWSEDVLLSTAEAIVYRQDAYAEAEETSTITCSYLDTNYSRQEYEQLRDMLSNNLIYNHVNAQISTSAVYTLAKDYLYIILVDDSSEAYRDVYYYVVGDYRCFCVLVREYRTEAEIAEAQDLDTPSEIGQKVAEGFVWK